MEHFMDTSYCFFELNIDVIKYKIGNAVLTS